MSLRQSVGICCDCRKDTNAVCEQQNIITVSPFVWYPSATGKCPRPVPRSLSRGSWPLLWRYCWYCSLQQYRPHDVKSDRALCVSQTPPCWLSIFLFVIVRTAGHSGRSPAEIWVRIPPEAWMFVVSVVCCQVEVSATSWSPVQKNPIDCGASLSVI